MSVTTTESRASAGRYGGWRCTRHAKIRPDHPPPSGQFLRPRVRVDLGVDAAGNGGSLIPVLLAPLGPVLAAVAVSGATDGRTSVSTLLRRLAIWRVNPLWYVAGIGLSVVIALLTLMLASALGVRTAIRFGTVSPFTSMSITSLLRSQPLVAYFVIAYAVSWAMVALISVSFVFALLALFGPAVAASRSRCW